jgi:hypothetical protein
MDTILPQAAPPRAPTPRGDHHVETGLRRRAGKTRL